MLKLNQYDSLNCFDYQGGYWLIQSKVHENVESRMAALANACWTVMTGPTVHMQEKAVHHKA
jgi:hypothetical protein